MIEHPEDREARLAEVNRRAPAVCGRAAVVAVLGLIAILVLTALGSLIETAPMGYLP